MIRHGREEYIDAKKKLVHYPFFDDPDNDGADGVYGLDIPLMTGQRLQEWLMVTERKSVSFYYTARLEVRSRPSLVY